MTTLLSAPPLRSTARPRHQLRHLGVIALGGLAAAVATVIIAGVAFETIASTLDRRAFPAPGRLVDVGGYQLHLACTGQGSPTVILETGLGATSTAWALVQPAVAASTRVCAYDRAGLGWSQAGPEPRDARHIAIELKSLLHAAGVGGPYVLVGHSNGALYSRMFASLYPTDVAGIVLIEATPSDLLTRLPDTRTDIASLPQQASTAEWLARFGLARLILVPKARAELDEFPVAERDAVLANQATSDYWHALGTEARAMEASLNQVQQAGGLGAWPLVVVWTPDGSPSAEAAAIKQELEDEMAGLSTNSLQVTVAGASHMSFATRPAHAAITTQAILDVVNGVRTGQPLSAAAAARS